MTSPARVLSSTLLSLALLLAVAQAGLAQQAAGPEGDPALVRQADPDLAKLVPG